MELRQIQYFIEVAKREHVTEAANALHVAQSAVSRQIANLEAELGVQLLLREGRNVRLTPIGRIFQEHAEKAILAIEKAQVEIKEFLDPERGTIRLGFPSSMASHILPRVISAFRAKYPHIGFQLRQGSSRQLIHDLVRGEVELAMVAPVPTDEKEFAGEVFFSEKLVALLPIGHELSDQPLLRLDQLRNQSFVLFPSGFVLNRLVVNACQQMGFTPDISFEGEDIDAIKGLVAAGLGVTLLPEITLMESIPRTTVKIPISEPELTRTVGIIIPKNRELPPSEKLFYQFLQEFFANLDRFRS
ncbi:LysR family transcriptional regulator [Kroppenstedtia eburnea]|uniref:LysR family transcriptional regulator, transcription activator of glutamate synthase operon n=1 Tax=Kroppenstedtia eburnea TaxID=714067 RepID=A0A1N7IXY6_9BACL|nr:LysR family transcriptional regulator [Kroppenstedtia eburnea]EGK13365.1 transcriptional regulator GltC [Desmospora sp. 8437]QKI82308.1 LysR family transcriptional regulator [Kroppenstedtia eburnea]SIS41914.1 LysR family transcriptional regulator, transcription activator of glutamate synthase operon [Kroppenstedtia eburnea]